MIVLIGLAMGVGISFRRGGDDKGGIVFFACCIVGKNSINH